MDAKKLSSRKLPRRQFLLGTTSATVLAVMPAAWLRAAQGDPNPLLPLAHDGFPPPILPAPSDPQDWPSWRQAITRWRSEARQRLEYDDHLYARPDFAWVSSCFTCCFLMLNDERFLDARNGRYLVEEFLEAENRQFGGYDAVVLWQAYPRIGLDERTQFDFYRDMPGGLAGLRDVSRRLHAHGVKVFLCYNPWDTGTRLGGEDHLKVLTHMIVEIEADGVFLDTMDKAGGEFREALDQARPGVALESELALPLHHLHDHHLSWMQWWSDYDSEATGVLRNKWFERRHMQHEIRRWNQDHSAELHTAWMNGSGMMVWENVFGQWVGWNERDKSILRSMVRIQRQFAALFSGEQWLPLVPSTHPGVFASQWGTGNLRLWTLINRRSQPATGPLLPITLSPDQHCFDLLTGKKAATDQAEGQRLVRGTIPANGIGCFLAAALRNLPPDFNSLLTHQREVFARHQNDSAFHEAKAARIAVKSTKHPAELPPGMRRVPAATIDLTATFQVREVGFYRPWTDRPITGSWLGQRVSFQRHCSLASFAIDETPVTNIQFARFLASSGYRPTISTNFLKHWSGPTPPPPLEDHPVVYVTIEDARAYAAWAGKRLPTEDEWQYAAQGPLGLAFPWGNQDDPARRNGGDQGGTTPVRSYPNGRSPFGVYDLCGNVWELTESEHTDERNRFLMLKGGSWYKAEGSNWYFDGGAQPSSYTAKMLLFWPGVDRCATVGFRCAVDLA